MRPLPRLFAITTDALCRAADFGVRAGAIASAGPAVAMVVRAVESTAVQQAAFAERVIALAAPPEAAVFVHARPDLAAAIGADGLQLRADDLAPADAQRVYRAGWIGRSVHSIEEARAAIGEGARYLVAGNVYATTSHPDRPPRGLDWLAEVCALGRPVVAIGGITAARAAEVRAAGAWGIAAISALWDATDPAGAAMAMLSPWSSAA